MFKVKKVIVVALILILALTNLITSFAKPRKGAAPQPPSNLYATSVTPNSISLEWTSSSTATGYNIYMATSSESNYVQIAFVTTNKLTVSNLKPSTSYWFYVRAYNSFGISSDSKHINVITLSESTSLDKEVLGFATYYYVGDKSSLNSMLNYTSLIDTIVTHTFVTDAQGNITGLIPTEQINFANSNGKIPLVMVSNNFNGEVAKQLLENPLNRQNLINNLINAVKNYGYKGVNIDLEGVYYYDRQYLSLFMKELYDALKPLNLIITISVPAKTYDSPTNSWSGAYDYAEISKYVDKFILMTYDEHYPWGIPGPIASIDWVRKVIDYTITVVPKEKILLGLAAYGYDWSSNGTKAYSISAILNLASTYGATILWDDVSKSLYFTYKDSSGINHTVWFENDKSISYKLDLVNSYNLKGIAIWRLGLENADYWNTIKTKLNR